MRPCELRRLSPEIANRVAFIAGHLESTDQIRIAGLPVIPKPFYLEEVRRVVREMLRG